MAQVRITHLDGTQDSINASASREINVQRGDKIEVLDATMSAATVEGNNYVVTLVDSDGATFQITFVDLFLLLAVGAPATGPDATILTIGETQIASIGDALANLATAAGTAAGGDLAGGLGAQAHGGSREAPTQYEPGEIIASEAPKGPLNQDFPSDAFPPRDTVAPEQETPAPAPIVVSASLTVVEDELEGGSNLDPASIPGSDPVTQLLNTFAFNTLNVADGTVTNVSYSGALGAADAPYMAGDFIVIEASDGSWIFAINTVTNEYGFELLGPLDHSDPNQTFGNDTLSGVFTVSVTGAGGTTSANITVTVNDDAPFANNENAGMISESNLLDEAGGAILLATDGAGTNLIARNADGNVIAANLFPGGSGLNEADNPEFLQLFTNMLLNVDQPGGGDVDVLIVVAGSTNPADWQAALQGTGLFGNVDILIDPIDPTVADFAGYDVVLTWSNAQYSDPVDLGDALKDFVDSGGGVVLATYGLSSPWAISGGITESGYLPLVNVGDNHNVSGNVVAEEPGDPIFDGVDLVALSGSFFHNSNFANPDLDGGGGSLVASGVLDFEFGADGPGGVSALTFVAATDPDNGNAVIALESGGQSVVFGAAVIDGNDIVLTGTIDGGATDVIEIRVDQTTGDYTITLMEAIDHPDVNETGADDTLDLTFSYTVTDHDGDSASAQITVNIKDDGPIANDDVDSVTEDGPLTATGNVVTAIDPGPDANGTDGVADNAGADGLASITWTGAVAGEVAGAHGTLTVDGTGNYSYALDNTDPAVQALNDGGTLTELFTYTIEDGDGDTATATLTITINGVTDTANAGDGSGTVREAALDLAQDGNDLAAGNVIGSDPTSTAETVTGSVTIDFGGDPVTAITNINLVPANVTDPDDGGAVVALTSGGNPVVTWFDGTDTIYGFVNNGGDPNVFDDGDTLVFEMTLGTDGNFTFTLTDQIDHPDGDETEAADPVDLAFVYTATDGFDSDNGTITITVRDDGPTLTVTASDGAAAQLATELDETLGADRYNVALAETEDAGGNANTDDGVGLGQVTTSVVGGLTSLFTIGGVAGADGQASQTETLSFVGIPVGGLLTTLSATDGGAITLFLEGGEIIGRDTTNDMVFKIAIVGNQLQTTLYEAIDHSGDGNLYDSEVALLLDAAGAVQLQFEVTRTDNDGDSITVADQIDLITDGTSVFSFDDDGPNAIDPMPAYISNAVGAIGSGSLDVYGNSGSDGFQTIVFTGGSDGDTLMGSLNGGGATTIQSGGHNILLSGFGTGVLTGYADINDDNVIDGSDTAVFTITLNPDATDASQDQYTIEFFAKLDDGSVFVFDDFSTAPAGQNKWVGLDGNGVKLTDPDPDPLSNDLLLTTIGGGTVNTSATDIGNANQWIDPTEGIRLDLVFGVDRLAGMDEKDVNGWTFSGHYSSNRFNFDVMQVQGGGLAAITVAVFYDMNGNTVVGDGSAVNIDMNNVVVWNGTTDVTGLVSITEVGDAVRIEGLQAGWTVSFEADSEFSSVQITNSSDGNDSPFAIGGFEFSTFAEGDNIALGFDVQLTDGDGDTSSGTIDVAVVPEGLTLDASSATEGTALIGGPGDDSIIGSNFDDIITGGAGADTIDGGSGDDTIDGGSGSDMLTGGTGADTFDYNTTADGVDTITDFNKGDGDQLDLSDVFDSGGDGGALDLSALVAGGYLILNSSSNVGGGGANDTQISVDLDGSGGGGFAPVQLVTVLDVTITSSDTTNVIV